MPLRKRQKIQKLLYEEIGLVRRTDLEKSTRKDTHNGIIARSS